jgi:hypothetical protein
MPAYRHWTCLETELWIFKLKLQCNPCLILLWKPFAFDKLCEKIITRRKFNTQIIWCRPCKDEYKVREHFKKFTWGFPLQISIYKLLESYNTSSTEFSINLTTNTLLPLSMFWCLWNQNFSILQGRCNYDMQHVSI